MDGRTVCIIGAGIVGLAVAFHLRNAGAVVTVVDRDPEGDKASFGNAGGIAVTEVLPAAVPGVLWRVPGWLLDPLGPLAVRPAHASKLLPWLWRFARASAPAEVQRIASALAALNGRVYDDLLPLLETIGRSGDLQQKGALTVYETSAGFARHARDWDRKRAVGIVAEAMAGEAARALEPALGALVRHAIFTPQWSHISDPKALVDALRLWLVARGATLVRGEVRAIETGVASRPVVRFADGRERAADRIVVAAGAWSGRIAKSLGDPVLLESERGYNTTLAEPGIALGREIIFAERQFVATPLACGLRIGGAAEFGGLGAPADHRRAAALLTLARRYLPGLERQEGVAWAGHRPTTPDSLPVIGPSVKADSVIYAFGHGHLGLTQAATTGRLVADLLIGRMPAIDLSPFSIQRFR